MNSWAVCILLQKRWRAIASSGLIRRDSCIVLAFPFETNNAANELISFLKPFPDYQMLRGFRFQQQSGLA